MKTINMVSGLAFLSTARQFKNIRQQTLPQHTNTPVQPPVKTSPCLRKTSALTMDGKIFKTLFSIKPVRWISTATLITVGGVELVTRFPSRAIANPLNLPANTKHLILILHGTGCKNDPTLQSIGEQFRTRIDDRPGLEIKNYCWSPYSDNALRAEAHARKIGPQIGKALCDDYKELESIHIISHSAGAFLQNPISSTIRAERGAKVHIESTFIDSMLMRGGWLNLSHGVKNYGKHADFALAIFTHNTPVPGCNQPLKHAHNIDMTHLFKNDDLFSYYRGPLSHFYPLHKYNETLSIEDIEPIARSFADFPKGEINYL